MSTSATDEDRGGEGAAGGGEPSALLPHHQQLLRDSAIPDEVALARGYRSVTKKVDLEQLGFSRRQQKKPALLIPLHGVNGELAGYQVRPDDPRVIDGRPVKYETPQGARNVLDVPPSARAALADPKVALWVTEGSRKADAAVGAGACCISISGVWGWRGTNHHEGKTALGDWDSVALNDREVVLAFDSDAMTKPNVHLALERLIAFLKTRQAQPKVVYLPQGEGAGKVGLDDYIAAGGTLDALLRNAEKSLRPMPKEDLDEAEAATAEYFEADGGIYRRYESKDGPVERRLTNFTARIVAEVARDDGFEVEKSLEIEAECLGRSATFTLPNAEFGKMEWPIPLIGPKAIVMPGLGLRDHARAAIQSLSHCPSFRQVLSHTGWREIGGEQVFLHAGGAIGTNGTVSQIHLDIGGALAAYVLPDPPEGDELVTAVRASLSLPEIAGSTPEGDVVTMPGLGLLYRTVLGECDLSLHLTGETGAFKSELLALYAQHFGPGMDRKSLPSWSSTVNYLEVLSSSGKNVVLPIDDLVPQGSVHDRKRLDQMVDRLFRGAGNRSGRGRLDRDGSMRPTRVPRATIFSTGEDIPQMRSCLARMLIIEVPPHRTRGLPKPGAIQVDALTLAQHDACQGIYAAATAGFVRWIAANYDEIQELTGQHFEAWRTHALEGAHHARDPEKVAHVMVGWEVFLLFAQEAGAVNADEMSAYLNRAEAALSTLGESQAVLLASSDPVDVFLKLLGSAIASGGAHVADRKGEAPRGDEMRWGWKQRVSGTNEWVAHSPLVGWVDGDGLYLDPDAALKAASAADPAASLPPIGTLTKRLAERGVLVSRDEQRGRYTIRKRLAGARRVVMHVAPMSVLCAAERPNRPNGPRGAPNASWGDESGQDGWDSPPETPVPPSQKPSQFTARGGEVTDVA